MSIDCRFFSFAAPPRTGCSWFLQACKTAGLLKGSISIEDVFMHFPRSRGRDELRVSVVRHPCRWLGSVYAALTPLPLERQTTAVHFLGTSFVGLDKSSFDAFVRSYLQSFPTGISCLFDRYECDVRFRLEDMPWALSELLEAFGVPRVLRRRMEGMQRLNCSERLPRWKPHLYHQVMETEGEFCHAFDYY